jgi:hypothetical protein
VVEKTTTDGKRKHKRKAALDNDEEESEDSKSKKVKRTPFRVRNLSITYTNTCIFADPFHVVSSTRGYEVVTRLSDSDYVLYTRHVEVTSREMIIYTLLPTVASPGNPVSSSTSETSLSTSEYS